MYVHYIFTQSIYAIFSTYTVEIEIVNSTVHSILDNKLLHSDYTLRICIVKAGD